MNGFFSVFCVAPQPAALPAPRDRLLRDGAVQERGGEHVRSERLRVTSRTDGTPHQCDITNSRNATMV
ncbi:hypothetical protein NHX12_013887 [Muraenolepis orangiensis]|uniref:Uncharacterized protein n=1 Tax=Muraenolepis orangiensis TaxID=630683 RepID=A0A9Q0DCI5_9TELE|nr:hypothetical protein NHX12_013887 [Muraenolepis orangiensis]